MCIYVFGESWHFPSHGGGGGGGLEGSEIHGTQKKVTSASRLATVSEAGSPTEQPTWGV